MTRPHQRRYQRTLGFMQKHLPKYSRVLDLGTPNPFSKIIASYGYVVKNTQGENLDTDYQKFIDLDIDVVTAFEIFEHMLAPFNILSNLKTPKLIASVPLKLWFSSAYWNQDDPWDRHYHEFEKRQFDFLLEQSGWTIKDSEMWTSPAQGKIGFRPLLRYIVPRYYIVYCERTE